MMLSWKTGGILLGVVFFAAVLLVKPIGVSTQFVVFDGILWDTVASNAVVPSSTAKSGYTSPNAYLAKSGGSYAKGVAEPLNYSFGADPGEVARPLQSQFKPPTPIP